MFHSSSSEMEMGTVNWPGRRVRGMLITFVMRQYGWTSNWKQRTELRLLKEHRH